MDTFKLAPPLPLYICMISSLLLGTSSATSLYDEIETSPNNKSESPKVDSGSSLNTAPG